MEIVLLDSLNAKVVFLDVEDAMIGDGGVDEWLDNNGYSTYNYEWFAVPSEYIPIEYHRYAIHKGDGKEVHETCTEMLRFGTPYKRVKDIKERERNECINALVKRGEQCNGGFEKHFNEENMPMVAGYLYDEPCDIVIQSVRADDDGYVELKGYDKNDPYSEQEFSASELFAGQLNEITEMI